jgi:hypothetical protein
MGTCNICGSDNLVIGDPTGIITVAGLEISCGEAGLTADLGGISEGACLVLQDAAGPCACQEICNICGSDNMVIGNPDGLISVDGLTATCADTQAAAEEENVSEGACEVLRDIADNCECRDPSLPIPVPAPSSAPSSDKVSKIVVFRFNRKWHPSISES